MNSQQLMQTDRIQKMKEQQLLLMQVDHLTLMEKHLNTVGILMEMTHGIQTGQQAQLQSIRGVMTTQEQSNWK